MKKYFILIGVIAIILVISLISAAWFTGKAVWNWNWCSPSNKCPAGEGDCDSNNDCKTGYCSNDVGQKYGQSKWMDVCECKSGETFYEGKCLTNDCYTLVSNIIGILNKNSQGVKCGDSNYKAIYDIDKDGYIVPKDSLIVTNKMSPDWCSERLKDTFDVCNSGEGAGSSDIKANSCDADDICDINTVRALKAIISEGITTGIIDIKSIRIQATDVDTITLGGKFIANDLISRNSLSTNYLKASDISTYTLQTALTGNGTAYACLDSNGRLFRSLTACR